MEKADLKLKQSREGKLKKSGTKRATRAPKSQDDPSAPAHREIRAPELTPAREWPFFIGIVLSLFCGYLVTLPQTVTFEDSGEFILSAFHLGIPHPPGYPLWTLIANAFTWLPVGSVAWRVHLFSALCGALSGAFFYLCAIRLSMTRWIALFTALAFGFSRTFWSQTIIAEVYALNILLYFMALWLCLRLIRAFSLKDAFALGLVVGLACSNHWPLYVLAGPSLILVLWTAPSSLKRTLFPAAVGGLLGLLPYVYLMVRSKYDITIAFLGPIRDLNELISYVRRDFYADIDKQQTSDLYSSLLFGLHFLKMLLTELSPLGTAFVGFGFWGAWARLPKKVFVVLVFAFVSSSLLLLLAFHPEYNEIYINVYSVFQLIPFGAAALLAGIGIQALADRFVSTPALRPRVAIGAAAAFATLTFAWNFSHNNLRTDTLASDYARLILDEMPPNATLIVMADADTGPLGYMTMAEQYRPDVTLVSQYAAIFPLRIYDPRATPHDDRPGMTSKFIQRHLPLYSTRRLDYLQKVSSVPFALNYNGLFYEITATPRETKASQRLLDGGKRLLDKIHAGAYKSHWQFHRNTLTSGLCNLLIINNIDHPLFTSHAGCMQIRARHYAYVKNYKEADKLFQKVLEISPLMPRKERAELGKHLFINRVNIVNIERADVQAKKRMLQDAVGLVMPLIKDYPACDNLLVPDLLAVAKQAGLTLDFGYLRSKLGHCAQLKTFM